MITPELISNWLLHSVVSFLASAAVAVIYHTPRKHIVHAGFTGMAGWLVYVILTHYGMSIVTASFFATVSLTVIARILAHTKKAPTSIFLVTGIFPLVPGLGIYNTGYSLFMSSSNSETLNLALTAISVAIAIALGMGLVLSLPQILFTFGRKPKEKGHSNETNN